jgi:hypothetical protein
MSKKQQKQMIRPRKVTVRILATNTQCVVPRDPRTGACRNGSCLLLPKPNRCPYLSFVGTVCSLYGPRLKNKRGYALRCPECLQRETPTLDPADVPPPEKSKAPSPVAIAGVMKRGYRYRQWDIGTVLGTDDLQAVERGLDLLIKHARVAREWSASHGEWLYRKRNRLSPGKVAK